MPALEVTGCLGLKHLGHSLSSFLHRISGAHASASTGNASVSATL